MNIISFYSLVGRTARKQWLSIALPIGALALFLLNGFGIFGSEMFHDDQFVILVSVLLFASLIPISIRRLNDALKASPIIFILIAIVMFLFPKTIILVGLILGLMPSRDPDIAADGTLAPTALTEKQYVKLKLRFITVLIFIVPFVIHSVHCSSFINPSCSDGIGDLFYIVLIYPFFFMLGLAFFAKSQYQFFKKNREVNKTPELPVMNKTAKDQGENN